MPPPPDRHLRAPGPPSGTSAIWNRSGQRAEPDVGNRPPGDGGRRGLLVALTVLVSVVLIGGVVAWWSATDDDTQSAAPTTTVAPATTAPETTQPPSTTTTAPPPPDDELLALLEEAKAFVTSVRGHEYTGDVDIRAISPDGWAAVIAEAFELSATELEIEAIGLVALGLLTPEEAETYPEDVIASYERIPAFYYHQTDRIVIRDGDRDAAFRRVLVHEATHALDDQLFDLARTDEDFPVDSEAVDTLELVVEGNAVRVEARWLAELDEAQRSAAGPAPVGRDQLGELADVVDFDIRARYLIGLSFAEHVAGPGGEAAVDRVLTDPPVTSEQVWFPAVFDRGEVRVDVPAPPVPDGIEATDEGPVGVTFWYGVLAYSAAELTPADAEAAVDGWGGDWQVTWGQDGFLCTRADVVGDTDDDTAELRDAIVAWADSTDGGVVATEVDGRVRVEYCVPDPTGGPSHI